MTPDTLSHRTIATLEPFRHELYALALAISGRPDAAEASLQSAIHAAFDRALSGEAVDVPAEVRTALLAANEAPSEETPAFMPADCWARITAAIQIQAARAQSAAGVRALNPESVLLNPDPLLAPRKSPINDDGLDPFDMSSTSRVVTAAIVALVIGITITIILTTRHTRTSPPTIHPSTLPTTTTAGV
jgi:hypothetical protein